MPKEQGHSGERVACSASKNAKDKSNSATLRASQGGMHPDQSGIGHVSSRMSRCDSEKDSGYSESGSDLVLNDLDDQRSSVSQPHRKSSKCRDNNRLNATGHSMPPYEELSPIYVIKNLVVKPSKPEHLLHSPLGWGGGWHGLTAPKAPTQLLLIQQPAIPAPSSSTRTPSSSVTDPHIQPKKGGSRSNKNHISKNSYLPILNSYPRIAPHPRKESHVQGKGAAGVGAVKESGGEGHSQSKRMCTEEEKRETVSTTSHLLKPQQQHHQKEGRARSHSQHKVGHSSFPNPPHGPLPGHVSSTTHPKSYHCHQSSHSDGVGSPSVSSSLMPSPPFSSDSASSFSPSSSSSPPSSAAHSPYRPAPAAAAGSLSDSQSECSSVRQRRFHNTTEILNQSGLLAITLHTKELLKQNAATEQEIAQLRQHAHLLCQAVQAGQQGSNDSSNSLEKLLQAMTQSGSYPSLDLNQIKVLGNNHQQSKRRDEAKKKRDSIDKNTTACHSPPQNPASPHNVDDGTLPPSPLFAPSPEPERIEAADSLSGPLSCHSTYFPRLVLEQGRRQAGVDKVLTELMTMSPESSTHKNYLL
ncbi:CLOCK-interacting pacemaker-like isoform 2-T2 [Polymixia lowei]